MRMLSLSSVLAVGTINLINVKADQEAFIRMCITLITTVVIQNVTDGFPGGI